MEDDLLINVNVADRFYRIAVKRGSTEEEEIRQAVKLIRDVMEAFKVEHPSNSEVPISEKDYLACATIQIAKYLVHMQKNGETLSKELEQKIAEAISLEI